MPPYEIGTIKVDMSGFSALQEAMSKLGATIAETSGAFTTLGKAMGKAIALPLQPLVYDEVAELTEDQFNLILNTWIVPAAAPVERPPDPPLPRRAISLVAFR